jgi:hypothetical protein
MVGAQFGQVQLPLLEQCSPVQYFPIIQQIPGFSVGDGLRPFPNYIFHPAGSIKRIEFADGQVALLAYRWLT